MENYTETKYREAMWKNKIPVKIDMAIEDINDVEKPPSFYVILILYYSTTFLEWVTYRT